MIFFDEVHTVERNSDKIQLISIYRGKYDDKYEYIQVESDLSIGSGKNVPSLHIVKLLDDKDGELLFEEHRKKIWKYGLNFYLNTQLAFIVSQIYCQELSKHKISCKCVWRYYREHLKQVRLFVRKFMRLRYVRLNCFDAYIFSSITVNTKRVIVFET